MGNLETAEFLDKLKDIGFKYATQGGLSVGIDDVVIPKEKEEIIGRAQKNVDEVDSQYARGFITRGERYNKVIDIWTRATTRVADRLFDSLSPVPRRIQFALYDGRLRRPGIEGAGTSAGRNARPDGQTAEEPFRCDG